MAQEVDFLAPRDRHFRLVADSPMPSVISDPRLPDNSIVAFYDAFCDLTGYPVMDVVGRNCRFLSGPATEPWLTEEIRCDVREHRPMLVEILNYKRSGQPFRIAPIYDEQDALLYFLGSQVEIDADASSPSSMRRSRAAERVEALSRRQGQVLKLVANGLLNKQIAAELDLAERTVKMHRAILMKRLGLHTTADLIRLAVEDRLEILARRARRCGHAVRRLHQRRASANSRISVASRRVRPGSLRRTAIDRQDGLLGSRRCTTIAPACSRPDVLSAGNAAATSGQPGVRRLALAAVHFGEDWEMLDEPLLRVAAGAAVGWWALHRLAPSGLDEDLVVQAFQLLASVAVPHLMLSRWLKRRQDRSDLSQPMHSAKTAPL